MNRSREHLLAINSKTLCPLPCSRRKADCFDHNWKVALKKCIRSRLGSMMKAKRGKRAIKFGSFTAKCMKYLNCSAEFYQEYIEERLTGNMTLGNHGITTWHIHHVKPIAAYEFDTEDDYFACFNYKNTKPLTAKENQEIGNLIFHELLLNKYIEHQYFIRQ